MRAHRDVTEQVVAVVGGTTAVGRAVVLGALARRARVSVAAPDAHALAALAAEADVPHRFEAVVVDPSRPDAAARVSYATTARFGLLHTWVHVIGRGGGDSSMVRDVAVCALRQLQRSGGGAFVVVAPEPSATAPNAGHGDRLAAEIAAIDALVRERHELSSVTLVRRTGVVPPQRVADAVLRAAVHPRPDIVVHGSSRRDTLARLVPAHTRRKRPLGVGVR